MKPLSYIKELGIDTLLDKCQNNLKIVQAHLIRECRIAETDSVKYVMKLIKNRQKAREFGSISPASVKDTILRTLKEEFRC